MPSSSHVLDRLDVTFDDDHAVADAGLVLPATLLEHLDAEAAADAVVTRGYRPGRKIITVLARLLAGADCIDDLASSVGMATAVLARQQNMTVLSTTRNAKKASALTDIGVDRVIIDDGAVADEDDWPGWASRPMVSEPWAVWSLSGTAPSIAQSRSLSNGTT